ncbi:hypothetical protein F5878DRAFT_609161 [Lentinula raphanica]|uniref:Uncharacterized protein n=1 Tax=Lentinula raphanica TaxID=153919 RepID=A0AA38PFC1_9AGAR|nr:hypothetical protein F5878DRAFT_609161 [Lentinula raphanica]
MYFLTLKALALASISVVSASLLMERQVCGNPPTCGMDRPCCTGFSCLNIIDDIGECLPCLQAGDTCTVISGFPDPCQGCPDLDLTCSAIFPEVGTCQPSS